MKTEIDWMSEAVCRSADMSLFFSFEYDLIEKAKLLCDGCPVKSDCLEIAIRREEHGVWGGTTTDERKELRRSLNVKVVKEPKEKPMLTDDMIDDESIEAEADENQMLVCPSHGDSWAPTGAWSDGRHEYVVLSCGCLMVDGDFIDGLEVGAA